MPAIEVIFCTDGNYRGYMDLGDTSYWSEPAEYMSAAYELAMMWWLANGI